MYGGPVVEAPTITDAATSDLPPAFTRGNFRDPVVEKVAAAHQTVAAYHKRDECMAAADLEKEQRQVGYGIGMAGQKSGGPGTSVG
jgi:hypothetical protein